MKNAKMSKTTKQPSIKCKDARNHNRVCHEAEISRANKFGRVSCFVVHGD